MKIYIQNFLLLLMNINFIKNTFTIDFSFLIRYSNDSLLSNNLIENPYNKSFLRNLSYYYNIKPMIKLCIGDPLYCFYAILSFDTYETIINLNSTHFNYKE